MSDLTFTIEPLSEELIEAYGETDMDRGQAGRHAIEWTFQGNPMPFAVAREAGVVIGVSGYIRRSVQLSSFKGVALQAVDSFVSERARGRGVFSRLAQAYHAYAMEAGADLVWGVPNNNAAPAWFGRLGWHRHGQTPFMIKPLRSGYFMRKLGFSSNLRVTLARCDAGVPRIEQIGAWGDALWDSVAPQVGASIIRDRAFLQHRLFEGPSAPVYRVVADTDDRKPAIVVTREAEKHGGRIAYVMEALGGATLDALLVCELGRLADREVELALAWAYPWSPNYRSLRKAGFVPLPERFRPINIWFGGRAVSANAACAQDVRNWYLSYLDSDTT